MSLSSCRSRRPNAGSRMSSMVDTNDEFYDSIYGGFNDEEEDNSYKSESSESDSVDSDFSIDEMDEQISDDQNEDQNKKKKKKIIFGFNSNKRSKKETIIKSSDVEEPVLRVPVVVEIPSLEPIISGRSLRSSERKSANSFANEVIVREEKTKQMKAKHKNKVIIKEMSQQEMLAEAIITESKNLESLKQFQKLQSENAKKIKPVKHTIKGPFIRYHSVSMPIIEELDENQNNVINNNSSAKKYSRNFLTFSDEENYKSLVNLLKTSSAKVSKGSVCPKTELPARYVDPVSQLPFATTEAFAAIRNEYLKQLEIHGNKSQPEVMQWFNWQQEYGDQWLQWQQKYNSYNKVMHKESETQSTHSQTFISKDYSIPKAVQTSRNLRRRKSNK